MRKHMGIITFFLFCCTLISVHLTSGLYAKYTVSESRENQADVIRFGNVILNEEGDFNSDKKLVVTPGVPLNYQVTVDFTGSEADVYLFVEVAAGKWISKDNCIFFYPNSENKQLEWKIDEAWKPLEDAPCVYYRCVKANETVEREQVIAEEGKVTVAENVTKTELQTMKSENLSMKFRAYVVQANGFANPMEAWNSIKNKGVNANEKN